MISKIDPEAAVRGELKKLFSNPSVESINNSGNTNNSSLNFTASPAPGLRRHADLTAMPIGRPGSGRSRSSGASRQSEFSRESAGRRSTTSITGGLICGAESVSKAQQDLIVSRPDPMMQALLARARRDINSKELPPGKVQLYDPGMLRYAKQQPVQEKQVPWEPTPSKARHTRESSINGPENKVSPKRTQKFEKNQLWSTQEESMQLSRELERLGHNNNSPMNWANEDIRNRWLRRETTSQLLQTLLRNGSPAGA